MAIQFYTGFDYFDQTQTTRVWSYFNGGNSLTPGRFGGRGWIWNNESAFLSTFLPGASTMILGMAFNVAFGDATNPFLIFQDATTSRTSPITQVDIRVTSDGALQATRNGTILGTTSPFLVTFGSWNYLEVKTFINNSTGYVIIRLNGAVFLNITGLDTQNTGNNYVNMVRFQPFASTGTYNFKLDDIYILDDTGPSPNNNFLGECRVQTGYPSANGDRNNFLPFGAVSNFQAVDEVIADDDTTYIRSSTVGDIDDFAMGTLSVTGTIYGVQLNVTYRKDDVGSRSITPIIKSGGTFYEGDVFACQSDYLIAQKVWALDPNTSLAWDNISVNAMTAGVKIKA